MAALGISFSDSSLTRAVSLPESRSSSHVLAQLAPHPSSGKVDFGKSMELSNPFKLSTRWWTPLFPETSEWSTRLKLFDDEKDSASMDEDAYHLQTDTEHASPRSDVSVKGRGIPRKSSGRVKKIVFTHEMARQLRKQIKCNDSFHDFMYHSAIASRLASHDT